MHKRVVITVLLAVTVLVAPIMGSSVGVKAASHLWGPWSCAYAVSGYPVTGGSLSGRGCASWWNGAELRWQVWADTYVPYSYAIQTYVSGQDRCSGGSWIFQMSASDTVYYDDYGTSTTAAGAYLSTCTSGHYYRTYYAGSRKATSSTSWQSASSYVYW